MTLKEKFRDKILSFLSDNMKEQNAEECEVIADDFAIDFAEWLNGLDINDEVLQKHISTRELLEIYKKQKGL